MHEYSVSAAVAACLRCAAAAGGYVLLSVPMTASAQQQNRGPAFSGPEEVVVTARRREESAQDIPISIQAFSQEDMELRNMNTGRDIGAMVPNVVIAGGGLGQVESELRIRGVPGVGIYLDGIWQGGRGALQSNLVEMQRVEVLRGPQGTLFGRNTNGGAIQYVTRLPGEEFRADVELTMGNNEQRDVKGSVDIPLTDTLFTTWTAAQYQRRGFLKSVTPTTPTRYYGGRDDILGRGDLLWKPTDDFSLRFTAFTARQSGTDARQTRISNPNNAHIRALNILTTMPGVDLPTTAVDNINYEAGYPGGKVGLWETRTNEPSDASQNDTDDYTLTANWAINDHLSVKSLTGFRTQVSRQLSSTDGGDFIIANRDDRYYDDNVFSQEFQLSGDLFGGKVTYLGGLYYSDTEEKYRLYRWMHTEWFVEDNTGDGRPDLNTERLDYVHAWGIANNDAAMTVYSPNNIWGAYNRDWTLTEVQDKAVFGEVDWNITDQLSASIGVRWSWRDSKETTYDAPATGEGAWSFTPPHLNGGHAPGDMYVGTVRSVEKSPDLGAHFTPKLSLSYAWTPDVMTYVSYAEGYSQGSASFVPQIGQVVVLDPEVVSTYEIGLRSEWLGGTLRFNTSYFTSKWDGLRVSRHPPDPNNPGQTLPLPYSTSDGKAKAQGVEVEMAYRPLDNLQLSLNGGWLDTKYLEIGDPGATSLSFDIPFAFAPEWSYSVGAQYDIPLSNGGGITLRSDYGWIDEYQRDAAASRQPVRGPEPAYGLLSMRARYTSASGQWSVSAFGTNLTDEHYADGGFDSRGPLGIDLNTVGPSRQFGLSLQFGFE